MNETNFYSGSVDSLADSKNLQSELIDQPALFCLVAQFEQLGTFYAPQNVYSYR